VQKVSGSRQNPELDEYQAPTIFEVELYIPQLAIDFLPSMGVAIRPPGCPTEYVASEKRPR
jgi:hypothetical protein